MFEPRDLKREGCHNNVLAWPVPVGLGVLLLRGPTELGWDAEQRVATAQALVQVVQLYTLWRGGRRGRGGGTKQSCLFFSSRLMQTWLRRDSHFLAVCSILEVSEKKVSPSHAPHQPGHDVNVCQ